MILKDTVGRVLSVSDNARLKQAIEVGAVCIDSVEKMTATILAPPGFDTLTDEEVLLLLRFAGECANMLEDVGFKVTY